MRIKKNTNLGINSSDSCIVDSKGNYNWKG